MINKGKLSIAVSFIVVDNCVFMSDAYDDDNAVSVANST